MPKGERMWRLWCPSGIRLGLWGGMWGSSPLSLPAVLTVWVNAGQVPEYASALAGGAVHQLQSSIPGRLHSLPSWIFTQWIHSVSGLSGWPRPVWLTRCLSSQLFAEGTETDWRKHGQISRWKQDPNSAQEQWQLLGKSRRGSITFGEQGAELWDVGKRWHWNGRRGQRRVNGPERWVPASSSRG